MKKIALSLFAVLLIVSPVLATDAPQWNGYVNDYAGILGNSGVLESMLRQIESNSTLHAS